MTRNTCCLLAAVLAAWWVPGINAQPIGGGFAYQGLLKRDGGPYTGDADFRCRLFDASVSGVQAGPELELLAQPVADGLFNLELDFGVDALDGGRRWLEIDVRTPVDGGVYSTLTRQPILSSPYAIQTRGFFVDSIERVGIGTTAPQAPLHVGGSNAFSLIWDEAAADQVRIETSQLKIQRAVSGASLVQLGSDVSAFGGGFLILNRNDFGQAGLTLDGNFGGTQSALLRLEGTGSLFSFDTSVAGTDSAVLPLDAIDAGEMLNEPGVASEADGDSTIGLVGAAGTIIQRSITCPSSGFCLVIASVQANASHQVGGFSAANFGVSDETGVFPANQDVGFVIPNSIPTGTFNIPVTVHGLFTVDAGENTFFFLGEELAGTITANDAQLTVVFIPTEYGTVTPTLLGGPADRDTPVRGVLSPAAMAAEIQTSARDARAVAEAERDAWQRRFEAMEARIRSLEAERSPGG